MFDKEKYKNLLEDKDMQDNIYNALINYNNIFKGTELSDEQYKILINKLTNYSQLPNALKYNYDILKLFETIKTNFGKIADLYKSAKEKNKKKKDLESLKINLESIIEPQAKDDLEKISNLYKELIKLQMDEVNTIFIIFSKGLFTTYMNYSYNKNINNLFALKEILRNLKNKVDISIDEKEFNKIIHQTGIELSKTHKLKNDEILKFIIQDIKYNKSLYKEGKLEVLDGIDISLIDEQFYEDWNKINWFEIFGDKDKYLKFVDKVLKLINNIKYFHIIYNLFDIDKNINENNQSDINKKIFIKFQNEFINLINSGGYLNNFDKDLIQLILYSEVQKCDIIKFLNKLKKSINNKTLNNIFVEILKKYKDKINPETKNIITNYIIEESNNSNSEIILYLLKECPEECNNILQRIEKFIPNKKDFWEIEENDKLKLMRGLLNIENLKIKEYQMSEYASRTFQIVNELFNDIKNGEILYRDINFFYNNNKKVEFKQRLLLICLNDNKHADELEKICDDYIETNKKVLYDLKLINDDLLEFLYNKEKATIQILDKMIHNINNGPLNVFNISYIDQYTEFNSKYKEKAEKRSIMKKSLFFGTIYKINSQLYKDNDEKCINETELKFEQLKNMFCKKGVHNLDKDILHICLNTIKGKKDEEITKEINILIDIFKEQIQNVYYNTKDLVDSMIILSKKDDIYNVAIALSIFIQKTGAKTDKPNKIDKIITDLKDSNEEKLILEAIRTLNDYSINIDILYDNKELKGENSNYLNILLKLKEQPDSITFLLKKSLDDCRSLQELVGEIDNGFLNTNDIIELEKCVEFMNKIGNEESLKSKKDIEVIKLFINEVQKSKGIEAYFKRYVDNYPELKNLLERGLDKSEASKQKIKFICQNSVFTLKSIKDQFFEGNYEEIEEENTNEKKIKTQTIKINLEALLELRDRAQLAKNTAADSDNQISHKKFLENNEKFIEKVTEIYNIYNLLKSINASGYPEDIIIVINIKNYESEYSGFKEKTKEYQNIVSKLKSILIDLRQSQIKAYRDKPLIRYIYGRQFNMIYNHLKQKEKNRINPFLMYITNNLISYYSLNDFSYKTNSNVYEDIINNCENFLKELLIRNNLDLKQIYKDSLIYEHYSYKGVYMYFCKKLEKDLFQIYKYLTKKTPIAQNILLCNKETSNEELTAFLYRAILCQFNSCFIIGGIELLEFEKKSKLLEILNNLYEDINKKMTSCLIILYNNKSSDIFKSLNLLKYKQDLNISSEDVGNLKIENSKVEIISSDKSGVGKSTQIKLEIEQTSKKYEHFPFGGILNRIEVVERLKELENSSNYILHLDLYDTDQTELMTEFLFSLLITKLYGQSEDMFYLSKKIEIKVEIPNGFVDFINKFPLLTLFPNRILLIKKLPPLIVPKALDSNIQIVANYLKALKNNNINDKDLFFNDITPEEFSGYDTKVAAEELSQSECQELIFNEIKKTIPNTKNKKNSEENKENPEPNYYQIKSFIDILATQFKRFNRNYYINANILNEWGVDKNIRTEIIENFIKLTKYFTKGAFTEIIASQEETHELLFGQYNAEKDANKGLEQLSNTEHDVISFDKINPSLLFFHEGSGQGFSIITNLPKEEKINVKIKGVDNSTNNSENNNQVRINPEYAKLYKLKNFQAQREEDQVDLPKYKEYKPIDFLKEIKEILDLPNPVKMNPTENATVNNNLKDNNKKDEDIDWEQEEDDEEGENIQQTVITKNEKVKKVSNKNIEELKPLEEIAESYVFTADNFVKMILILLRIRANIPVIMMGETGCGKTSLIRKLSQLLNNGSTKKMKILNIHAGTTDKDIINFIEKKVIKAAEELKIEDDDKKEKFKEKQIYEPRKLWVFLDEINTCKSMGLISELMCKHTYHGKELPSNVVFIAACNPYRYGKKQLNGLDINKAHKEKENLDVQDLEKLKKSATSSLVYTVNPLPHSLLNFVFDFGNLTNEDEERYIESIILEPIERINRLSGNKSSYKEIHNLAKKLISQAQNFIRDKNDKSSVSLREIRRFNIFYEFFFNYLKKKKEQNIDSVPDNNINFYRNLDSLDIQKYSVILAIFVCYYLRIPDIETREELEKKMNETLKEFSFKGKNFLDIPLNEEKYVVDNIELEKGIAKNRALLDNIFSLFVAINNKVPIFIVGKPGCSKSLSVQLINKSMKGTSSSSDLFKDLPKIILNSYQGSMSSTSQGVKNVFKKARRALKRLKNKEDRKNNISMIYFDEMGLAEHSPNNPLKVIHAELEYDLNKGSKKVAFVGISNWALDASKMNRGMFLSIPEPCERDTKETAFTIGMSYDNNMANQYKSFFEMLGLTYFKYKNFLKEKEKINQDGKEDFHGNRDFYHLIKNSASNILKIFRKQLIGTNDLQEIAVKSVERNFGGLKFNYEDTTSIKVMKEILSEFYPGIKSDNYYKVINRIKENINDLKSRYLLVISKSSISTILLSSILSDLKKDYNLYIGSQFKNDLKSEEYSLKILNKIQLHMEQGNVLILKNLESVYPALYDLFNQNFTEVSKKNYARIAIGSSTNAFSFVDKNFRCIVNVDYDQIDHEEAPFLNRFEKHIVSFEYLLDKSLIEESKKIYNILSELISYDKKKFKGINYNLEKIFINFDLEEIQGIIYEVDKRNKRETEGSIYESSKENSKNNNLLFEVISKISLILPQDILICLK